MQLNSARKFMVSLIAGLLIPVAAWAYVPEPKSEGKFEIGKGTRSEESYEQRAGAPVYDYETGKGLHLGPVLVKPEASYRYVWEDNVFWEDRNEKSDYHHTLTTNVRAELPFAAGQHLAGAQYSTYSEFFDRFATADHTDHKVGGSLDLNFVPFTLNAEHTYERTVSRANTEFTSRVKRDEQATHTLVEVPFASFFLENEITNFNINYQAQAINDPFDHNEFTMYQRVGYDLTPVTQILGEYAYKNINYDNFNDRNGDANQFMAGVRGAYGARIVYQVWAGTQLRIYDQDERPDFTGFATRGALQFEISELSSLTLRGDRSPQESTFDNQSFYVRNRLELLYRRQIAERWFTTFSGSYDFNEYSRITVMPTGQETTRRDSVWGGGAGLEYRMPNDIWSFLVEYRFDSRHSNILDFDYDSNAVTAGVRAAF